jgi:outer membrane biosynthesis protein TonB
MSNTHKLIITLLLLLATGLACNSELSISDEPRIFPTRTPLPTFTPASPTEVAIVIPPTPTETPTPTSTFTPEPTETPTEIPTEVPTENPTELATEEPPTNTPEPARQIEHVSEPEPQPTQAEEPPPPAAPITGAHGVVGNVTFRDGRNTYGVGEQVFAHIEATNTTDSMVSFGILGLATSTGQFQSSWTEDAIAAGGTFNHEDGIAFPTPGNHKLWLSVCFSTKAVCQSPDGDWERFEPGLDVVIQ